MTSSIRYLSFKVMPKLWLLALIGAAIALSLIFLGLSATLLGAFLLYAFCGPVLTLGHRSA